MRQDWQLITTDEKFNVKHISACAIFAHAVDKSSCSYRSVKCSVTPAAFYEIVSSFIAHKDLGKAKCPTANIDPISAQTIFV